MCFESFLSAICVRIGGGLKRNQVQWTRFLCTKTESSGLDFYVQKPSSEDSIFMYKNRVHRTRFLCTKTESSELNFWVYVDTLSTSVASKIGNSSTIYSIYNPKIKSSGLELLETKYV